MRNYWNKRDDVARAFWIIYSYFDGKLRITYGDGSNRIKYYAFNGFLRAKLFCGQFISSGKYQFSNAIPVNVIFMVNHAVKREVNF